MGKRKAGESPAPAPAPAGAAAAARQPVQVIPRKRARAFNQEVRWLNAAFADYVSSRRDTAVALDGAAEDYLRYWAELQDKYRDVVQPGAAGAAFARARGGAVFMVGTGDFGQLGLGEEVQEKTRPFPLDAFGGLRVTAVACGGMHALAITEDGAVHSWGVNDDGPLGRELPADVGSAGGEANQTGWTPGVVALPGGAKACAVCCGDSHSVALTPDGKVFGWGTFRDKSGVLGFSESVRVQRSPALLFDPASPGERVTAMSSGADHVLLLTADGVVLSFGCAEKGRLGRLSAADADAAIGDVTSATERAALMRIVTTPTPVPGLPQIASIAAGLFCSLAIGAAGEVFSWGLNNYGQLGIPFAEAAAVYTPRRVRLLDGRGVKSLSSGEHHTLALTADGTLLSFGRATYGRLGRTDVDVAGDTAEHEPKPVDGFDSPVVCMSAGVATSAAVTSSGAMYVWGYGGTGMLGKGDDDLDELVPHRLAASKHFPAAGGISVTLGGQHAAWLAAPPADGLAAEAPAEKLRRSA